MKLLDFIFAARPLLHIPIWTVYLITLHHHRTTPTGSIRFSDILIMTGLSLLFTGAVYINQIYDYESDLRNRKLGFLQRDMITKGQMRATFWITCLLAVVLSLFFDYRRAAIYLVIFALAYTYSAPLFRLKDRPLFGLYANALAHGYLVSLAAVPLTLLRFNTAYPWYLPVYFTITVGAIYIVTTIPDMRGDAGAGKRTISVCLGRKWALGIAVVLLSLSIVPAWVIDQTLLVSLSILTTLTALLALITGTERVVLATAKVPLLLLTILAGYYYWPYLVFIVAVVFGTRLYYRRRFDMVYPRLT